MKSPATVVESEDDRGVRLGFSSDSGSEFGSRLRSGSVWSEWSISDVVRVNSINSDNASQLSSVRVNTAGTGQTVRVTASVHMFGSSSARSTVRSGSSGFGSEFVEQYGSCQTQSNRANLGQTRSTQPVDSVKLWVNSVILIDGTARGFGILQNAR
ncbi:hypothetical protein HanHA300_Chr10g0354571 [Helianthus annuus]|nr:hypothetical protein HanHA300_Chr10g0354571 [Helianthus annuus]KAJ0529312.1 hypothetical protein HanHA89_Chr10g0376261 [Helianthus annuus]KAJ0696196.1 hypothetical protein HanLR1_Chr10g0354141 [Helianthus annuus]